MIPALVALVSCLAPAFQTPAVTDEVLVRELEDLVRQKAAAGAFSGTVLLARDGDILLEVAVGEASRRFHVPNDIETKFNLGSMNKMFTSVAVLQLKEQDKLELDDPISKFVDESWLPREITDRVTVLQLLTHTSGLGSYFNETYAHSSRMNFREVDDYKPLVQGDTLAFEPGQRWQYSNTGMLLLGVVIEKASGQNYFDYIREHVYAPAEMTNTDCYDMDEPVENLAIGYSPDETSSRGWRNNLYAHVIRGGPAGGGFSTVRDLFRFAQALLEGRLVSVESLDTLWSDQAGADYGCGFSVVDGPAGKVVGHGGGFSGISSNLDLWVDQGFVVVVLSNLDGGAFVINEPVRAKLLSLAAR